jgi:hypothetical protein
MKQTKADAARLVNWWKTPPGLCKNCGVEMACTSLVETGVLPTDGFAQFKCPRCGATGDNFGNFVKAFPFVVIIGMVFVFLLNLAKWFFQ